MNITVLALLALMVVSAESIVAVVLVCAALLLAGIFQVGLGFSQLLMALLIALSFPAAAMISTALLERFCEISSRPSSLIKLSGLLAICALLLVAPLEKHLYATLTALPADSASQLPMLISLVSNVLFCGCVSAFAIIVSILLFEGTAQFLLNLFGFRMPSNLPLSGLRIILVFTLFTWSLHLVAGLYEAELSPAQVIGDLKLESN